MQSVQRDAQSLEINLQDEREKSALFKKQT
jgi:hypothetical protein